MTITKVTIVAVLALVGGAVVETMKPPAAPGSPQPAAAVAAAVRAA